MTKMTNDIVFTVASAIRMSGGKIVSGNLHRKGSGQSLAIFKLKRSRTGFPAVTMTQSRPARQSATHPICHVSSQRAELAGISLSQESFKMNRC
jgi:hypothetical protein